MWGYPPHTQKWGDASLCPPLWRSHWWFRKTTKLLRPVARIEVTMLIIIKPRYRLCLSGTLLGDHVNVFKHSSNSVILESAWNIYSLGEMGPRAIFQPASRIEGLPTESSVHLCFWNLGRAPSDLGWALKCLGWALSGLEITLSGLEWAFLDMWWAHSGLEGTLSSLGWSLSGLARALSFLGKLLFYNICDISGNLSLFCLGDFLMESW